MNKPLKLKLPFTDPFATPRTDLAERIGRFQDMKRMECNLNAVTAALLLAHDFLEDLRTSNPGYLGKLALQDYSRVNRLGEIVTALKKAGCTEGGAE